jgi:DNA-binding MarR family transcriptional regulator
MRRNTTMTRTQVEAGSAVPVGLAIGQAVGQAQAVLTRLLTGALAGTGTGVTRETYLALLRLSAHGDSAPRDACVRDLSDSLDLDLWAAGELVSDMAAAGLVTVTEDRVLLTDAGADLRVRLRQAIGDVTAPLYAPLDPADIEITVRTLRGITERAWAMRGAWTGAAGVPVGVDGGRS